MKEVEAGTAEAAKSVQAVEDILEQINAVSMQMRQIATATEEQTVTTGEISNKIQMITQVMQGSSDVAKDAAAAAGELAEIADELRQIVGRFRLVA